MTHTPISPSALPLSHRRILANELFLEIKEHRWRRHTATRTTTPGKPPPHTTHGAHQNQDTDLVRQRLKEVITDSLEDFISNPDVTVMISQMNSNTVSMLGGMRISSSANLAARAGSWILVSVTDVRTVLSCGTSSASCVSMIKVLMSPSYASTTPALPARSPKDFITRSAGPLRAFPPNNGLTLPVTANIMILIF